MNIFNIVRDSQINSLEESDVDCSDCGGKCCSMNWLIELTSDESKRLKNTEEYNRFFIERKKDNSCVYQLKNGMCSIHERRPTVCRHYDCRKDDRKNNIPNCKYEN
jgi:Fe-S-cluster containining protein